MKQLLPQLKSIKSIEFRIKSYYNLYADNNASIYGKAYDIWQNKHKMDYNIDGIIFTPIEQNYVSCMQILPTFKWKPMHTIDVRVEYIQALDFTFFHHCSENVNSNDWSDMPYNSNNNHQNNNNNNNTNNNGSNRSNHINHINHTSNKIKHLRWCTIDPVLCKEMNDAKMGMYRNVNNKLTFFLGKFGKPFSENCNSSSSSIHINNDKMHESIYNSHQINTNSNKKNIYTHHSNNNNNAINNINVIKNKYDIVEYGYDLQTKQWTFIKLRTTTKNKPNGYKTIQQNILATLHPITIDDIKDFINKDYNYDYVKTYCAPHKNSPHNGALSSNEKVWLYNRKTWRHFNNYVKKQLLKQAMDITIMMNNDKNRHKESKINVYENEKEMNNETDIDEYYPVLNNHITHNTIPLQNVGNCVNSADHTDHTIDCNVTCIADHNGSNNNNNIATTIESMNKMNKNNNQINHNNDEMNHNQSQMNHNNNQMNHNTYQMNHNQSQMNHNNNQINHNQSQMNRNDNQMNHFSTSITTSNTAHQPHYHLDLGCGPLGDLWKYIQCNYQNVLAVDLSAKSIEEATNRIILCNQFIKVNDTFVHKNGLKITLIQADMSSPLYLNKSFRKYIDTLPNTFAGFDSISCMFSLHYAIATQCKNTNIFIEDTNKLNGFCHNIEHLLKNNGIFLGTFMNGNKIKSNKTVFKENNNIIFKIERLVNKKDDMELIKMKKTNISIKSTFNKSQISVDKLLKESEMNSNIAPNESHIQPNKSKISSCIPQTSTDIASNESHIAQISSNIAPNELHIAQILPNTAPNESHIAQILPNTAQISSSISPEIMQPTALKSLKIYNETWGNDVCMTEPEINDTFIKKLMKHIKLKKIIQHSFDEYLNEFYMELTPIQQKLVSINDVFMYQKVM